MNPFLPLMNYGDQLAKSDTAPLGGNLAGLGATGYSAPGNTTVTGYYNQTGIAPTVQGGMSNMTMASGYLPTNGTNGCPPCNCPTQKSPLENETVQYALLFALAYVVIKKL
jgi:hypothetical protein